MKNQQEQFMVRVKMYISDNEKLLKKYKLSMWVMVNFPRRLKIPLLSRIALWIVGKQGGILDINISDKNKK